MTEPALLHELLAKSAASTPDACALSCGAERWTYASLCGQMQQFAAGLMHLGLARADRVAVFLEKRLETVVSSFGTSAAGGVLVPVNPLLKPKQVVHILQDCNVRVLVTSVERLAILRDALADCPDLRWVVLTGGPGATHEAAQEAMRSPGNCTLHGWDDVLAAPARAGHRLVDVDLAAIFYTSGSTGKPKGVMLSHRNLVAGATSVASYLENTQDDVLLAALPLSFDAGFSQLTTGFYVGAQVVLLNYLMPRDVLKAMVAEKVTGLTAVPPLYIQLARLEWPAEVQAHLRYFANTGGHMPTETLNALRARAPGAKPFLMYGLTEAFRSTYLHPDEVDRRPDSMGKAIPNTEVLVLREDGTPCAANEPGELVHRGATVALGYWNNPGLTAERFRVLPNPVQGLQAGLQLPEYVVFSGDTVRQDEDGFLYFLGRQDEMIKTSGYRVSPTEVEEILYSTRLVGECVAFGVEDPVLGSAIQVIASPADGAGAIDLNALYSECRARMPAYMVPADIEVRFSALPRNANGKLDRALLKAQWTAGKKQ